MNKRWLYPFGHPQVSPLSHASESSFGSLGSALYQMGLSNLPLAPGFIIPIEFFTQKEEPMGLEEQISNGLKFLNSLMKVGGKDHINLYQLNYSEPEIEKESMRFVGCTTDHIPQLILATGNGRFSWAEYAQYIAHFVRLVGDVPQDFLENEKQFVMQRMGVSDPDFINADGWIYLIERYQTQLIRSAALSLPQSVEEQIALMLYAIRRNVQQGYQKPSAVILQAELLGNIGTDSGVGYLELERFALEAGHLPMGSFAKNCYQFTDKDQFTNQENTVPLYKTLVTDAAQVSLQCHYPQAAEKIRAIALPLLDALGQDHAFCSFTLQSGKLWLNRLLQQTEDLSNDKVIDLFVDMAEKLKTSS